MKGNAMNKRDVILGLANPNQTPSYIPAAFFLHFPQAFHQGPAAVSRHLEYFRFTGMDFVKIQYERPFPSIPEIKTPDDWEKMPCYGRDFYAGQLEVVKGLVQAASQEAVVVVTLYSAFMCAAHTTSREILVDHLNRKPEKARKGLEIITNSLLGFVKECIQLGVDGFYMSTQGGESSEPVAAQLFAEYIKPLDFILMEEANRACPINILHVCDYEHTYSSFSPFFDYPGTIVNSPLKVAGDELSPRQAADLFKRPYMGGLDRLGVIANGTPDEIRQAVGAVLEQAPSRFILAADCTVPANTPWENLKIAIETAHQYSGPAGA
jgi:uroporphyrinogen decarboxylase